MSMQARITRRNFHRILAGATTGLAAWRFGSRTRVRAAPAGTWTLFAPCSVTSPYAAGDYPGHSDNALDFGGAGGTSPGSGTPVQVYFNAGPFTGFAKIANVGTSCSSAYFSWHKRVTFDLYDDCPSPKLVASGMWHPISQPVFRMAKYILVLAEQLASSALVRQACLSLIRSTAGTAPMSTTVLQA